MPHTRNVWREYRKEKQSRPAIGCAARCAGWKPQDGGPGSAGKPKPYAVPSDLSGSGGGDSRCNETPIAARASRISTGSQREPDNGNRPQRELWISGGFYSILPESVPYIAESVPENAHLADPSSVA